MANELSIEHLMAGKPKEEHERKRGKRHPFRRTVVEHHDDGSHTVRHEHEEGVTGKDVSYAVPDLDGVHDGLEANVGEPNPGEEELQGEERQ